MDLSKKEISRHLGLALESRNPVEQVAKLKAILDKKPIKAPSQVKEKILFNQTSRTTWEVTISHTDSLNIDEVWADFVVRRSLRAELWKRTPAPVLKMGGTKTFLFTMIEAPKKVYKLGDMAKKAEKKPVTKKLTVADQIKALSPAEAKALADTLAALMGK